MRRIPTLILLTLTLMTPALAEPPSDIQNHPVQTMFWTAPCRETVGLIDAEGLADMSMEATINFYASKAIAWGHLLGFESAHPGIRGTHETILMRLRTDCAANLDKTAMDLLQGYAQDLD